MLKKLNAILSLLVLASPLLLWLTMQGFIGYAHYVREHASAHERVQKIVIAKNQIVWKKHNKEIIINGEYFDIVKKETKGDSLILTGFYDSIETEALAVLAILEKNNDDQKIPSQIGGFISQQLGLPNAIIAAPTLPIKIITQPFYPTLQPAYNFNFSASVWHVPLVV
jgi:hypothetical protein